MPEKAPATPSAPTPVSQREKARARWLECVNSCRDILNREEEAVRSMLEGVSEAQETLFERDDETFRALAQGGAERILEYVLGIVRRKGVGVEFLQNLRNNSLGMVEEALAALGKEPVAPAAKPAGRGFSPRAGRAPRTPDGQRYRVMRDAWVEIFKGLRFAYAKPRQAAIRGFGDQLTIMEKAILVIRNPQQGAAIARAMILRSSGCGPETAETSRLAGRVCAEARRVLESRDSGQQPSLQKLAAAVGELPPVPAAPWYGLPEDMSGKISAEIFKAVTDLSAPIAEEKPAPAKSRTETAAPKKPAASPTGGSVNPTLLHLSVRAATLEMEKIELEKSLAASAARENALTQAAEAAAGPDKGRALADAALESAMLRSDVTRLQSDLDALNLENEHLQELVSSNVDKSDRRRARKTAQTSRRHKDRARRLKSVLEEAREELARAQERRAEAETDDSKALDEANERVAEAERRMKSAEAEVANHKKRSEELAGEVAQARADLESAEAEALTLEAQAHRSEEQERQLASLTEARSHAETRLEEARQKIAEHERAERERNSQKAELKDLFETENAQLTEDLRRVRSERESLAGKLASAIRERAESASLAQQLAAGWHPETERRFRVGAERKGFDGLSTDELIRYLAAHPQGDAARQEASAAFDKYVNEVKISVGNGKSSSTQGKTDPSSGNFINNLYEPLLESLSQKTLPELMSVDVLEEVGKHQDRKGQNKAFYMELTPFGHVRMGAVGALRLVILHMRRFQTGSKTALSTVCDKLEGHLHDENSMKNLRSKLIALCEGLAENHPSGT